MNALSVDGSSIHIAKTQSAKDMGSGQANAVPIEEVYDLRKRLERRESDFKKKEKDLSGYHKELGPVRFNGFLRNPSDFAIRWIFPFFGRSFAKKIHWVQIRWIGLHHSK